MPPQATPPPAPNRNHSSVIRDTRDRFVFASHPDGSEVVRYEKAGKWYVEHPSYPSAPLTVREAAVIAARFRSRGGHVYPAMPGGRRFYLELARRRK